MMRASHRLSESPLEDGVLHSFGSNLLLLYFILISVFFLSLKFSTTSVVL